MVYTINQHSPKSCICKHPHFILQLVGKDWIVKSHLHHFPTAKDFEDATNIAIRKGWLEKK